MRKITCNKIMRKIKKIEKKGFYTKINRHWYDMEDFDKSSSNYKMYFIDAWIEKNCNYWQLHDFDEEGIPVHLNYYDNLFEHYYRVTKDFKTEIFTVEQFRVHDTFPKGPLKICDLRFYMAKGTHEYDCFLDDVLVFNTFNAVATYIIYRYKILEDIDLHRTLEGKDFKMATSKAYKVACRQCGSRMFKGE